MKTGGGGVYDKPSQNSNYVTGVYYIYEGRHVLRGGGACEMFPKSSPFVPHLSKLLQIYHSEAMKQDKT